MYRPEVGEECYVQTEEHAWLKSTIKIYDAGDVIYRPEGRSLYIHDCNRCQFRPLKSKRDEEIEEMMDCSSVSNYATCTSLYDAGYRKQLPYSQFVSIIQAFLANELEQTDYYAATMARSLAAKLNRTPDEE